MNQRGHPSTRRLARRLVSPRHTIERRFAVRRRLHPGAAPPGVEPLRGVVGGGEAEREGATDEQRDEQRDDIREKSPSSE